MAISPLPQPTYGCSSEARAAVSKTARRGFNSFHPCQVYPLVVQLVGRMADDRVMRVRILPEGPNYLGVAQHGRVPALEAGDRRFESYHPDQNMVDVAQLVERQIVTLVVVGSNPIVHPNAAFV